MTGANDFAANAADSALGTRRRVRTTRVVFSTIFRSERHTSAVLLGAAILGLVIANTPLGPLALDYKEQVLAIPALGLHLTVGEWIADLLLAAFFFIVAVELRAEMTTGELNSVRKALVPTIAALGGVVAPALVYLLMSGGGSLARGWPVPTATDIAFAVGVLAVFGKFLPTRMRVFLLALAVIDDLIGITLIGVLFSDGIDPLRLVLAAASIAAFALTTRARSLPTGVRLMLALVLALVTWYLVQQGGIHPTIAAVLLGLVIAPSHGAAVAHHMTPWSAGVVLPLFALTAALVIIPAPSEASPVLIALALALPIGKTVGIFLGGLIGARVAREHQPNPVLGADLLALAVTGGLGFTVALLMGQLAFRGNGALIDDSVLGVLIGSGISLVVGAALITWRSKVHRRRQLTGVETTEIPLG